MRVVLDHKIVLADRLTWQQANDLLTQIANRHSIKDHFKDKIYMESIGPGFVRLTMLMPYVEQFTRDPHSFIFDV